MRIKKPVAITELLDSKNMTKSINSSSASTTKQTSSTESSQPERINTPISKRIVRIFKRLEEKYGKPAIASKYGNDESLENVMRSWDVSDLNYFSNEIIGIALQRCNNEYSWPPTLREFLNLCERYSGFVQPQQAYDLACTKQLKDLDVTIRFAIRKTGLYELRGKATEQVRKKFMSEYRDAVARFRAGEDLSQYLAEVTETKQLEVKPASSEFAKPHIDNLKSFLRGDHDS